MLCTSSLPSEYPCSLCHAVLRYDACEVLIGVLDHPIQSPAQPMEKITSERANVGPPMYQNGQMSQTSIS